MTRVFNFSAGPAACCRRKSSSRPSDEMLDWHGQRHVRDGDEPSRQGVHRRSPQQAEADLRELLAVPANYKVLFLQGGATAQFAAVPHEPRDRGVRSRTTSTPAPGRRRRSARRSATARSTSRPTRGAQLTRRAGPVASWKLTAGRGLRALHAERDHRRRRVPVRPADVGDVPLVADMSSTILSRPIDVSPLRRHLCRRAEEHRPGGARRRHRARRPARPARAGHARRCSTTRRWRRTARCSTRRRPIRWYLAGLVFQWLKRQGGLGRDGRASIAPRPRSSTARSTDRASTRTRSRRRPARG